MAVTVQKESIFSRKFMNMEIKVLLVLLMIIFCVWIFFLVANAVTAGSTRHFDMMVIQFFRQKNNRPWGPFWLPEVMRDITSLGSGTVVAIITMVVFFFLLLQKKYPELLLILIAVIGGAVLGLFLKGYFGRERPDLIFRITDVRSLSFPSGHSMMSTVIYLTLAVLIARIQRQKKIRIYIVSVAVVLAFIIGVSRVYLGVHYPTDVIGGWTMGLAWASFCWFAARYLQRKKVIEPET